METTGRIITDIYAGRSSGAVNLAYLKRSSTEGANGTRPATESRFQWRDLQNPNSLPELLASVERNKNNRSWDCYFSTQPSRTVRGITERTRQSDVSEILCIAVDIDTQAGEHDSRLPKDPETVSAALMASIVPPTSMVCSGHGLHAYWILSEGIEITTPADLEAVKSMMRNFVEGLEELTGIVIKDKSASEPARILRVDGTQNNKRRTPTAVTYIPGSGLRYVADDLAEYIEAGRERLADGARVLGTGAGQASRPATGSGAQGARYTDPFERLRIALDRDADFAAVWNGSRIFSNGADNSESVNDLGIMKKLVYWLGRDFDLCASLFRSSPYYSQKDAAHKRKADKLTGFDYLRKTFDFANSRVYKTSDERYADFMERKQKEREKEQAEDHAAFVEMVKSFKEE